MQWFALVFQNHESGQDFPVLHPCKYERSYSRNTMLCSRCGALAVSVTVDVKVDTEAKIVELGVGLAATVRSGRGQRKDRCREGKERKESSHRERSRAERQTSTQTGRENGKENLEGHGLATAFIYRPGLVSGQPSSNKMSARREACIVKIPSPCPDILPI